MIAVPLKESKSLDWYYPINACIVTHYGGSEIASKYRRNMSRLNDARDRAIRTKACDPESIEGVKHYFRLLNLLELKFPSLIGNLSGQGAWRGLEFSWTDSNKSKIYTTRYDIEYEKCCVLFNIGALESQAGIMSEKMKNSTGYKAARESFSRAAGIFQYLEVEVAKLRGDIPSDFIPQCLAMYVNLMLAQAHDCFFSNALLENKSPKGLAKIASQISVFYDTALTYSKHTSISKALNPTWSYYFEFYSIQKQGISAYYMALSLSDKVKETNSGYGLQASWAIEAERLTRAAWEFAKKKKLPSGVVDAVIFSKITDLMEVSVHDNANFYHEAVPSNLTRVDCFTLDAVSIDPTLFELPTESLFINLLLPWMRTAEDKFQTRLTGLFKPRDTQIKRLIKTVKEGLHEAGLPGSLEASSTVAAATPNIPDSLWRRVNPNKVVQGSEGNRQVNIQLNERLKRLQDLLNSERDADEFARNQYGGNYREVASRELNQLFYSDILQYRTLLAQTANSDASVVQQIQKSSANLTLLSKSREEIAMTLPAATAVSSVAANPKLEQSKRNLNNLLSEIDVYAEELETSRVDLENAVKRATCLEELQRHGERNAAYGIEDAIKKFDPALESIDRLIDQVTQTFHKILEENHIFARLRIQDESTKRREVALTNLERMIENIEEIDRVVQEGSRFYNDMRIQIDQLQIAIEDFCYSRSYRRDEAIAILLSGSTRTSVPPPPIQPRGGPPTRNYYN